MHVHTTASDGVETPKEVILSAIQAGLKGLAITDHDTVDGIEPALQFIYDTNVDIDFIPGIELNTDYGNDEVHILGYFIDFHNNYLIQRLSEIRNQRYERAVKIIAKLNEMGIDIKFQEVQSLAKGNLIGRPHIARVLCQKGYGSSLEEAFEKYISKGKPAYVPRYKFHPSEAIRLIQQTGGIAVLAHPGLINELNKINEIINMGIEGLEIYYPEHNAAQIQSFNELAQRNNILITGGSDYHGAGSSESRSKIGGAGINSVQINRIKEYYRGKMQIQ